jgi:uncharacterized OsmC-like protein
MNGTYSRSTIDGFSGLGQDHLHKSTFTIDADHPTVFASEDRGATPVEIVLSALGSCLTAASRPWPEPRHSAAVGHRHDRGTMNILGILGADPDTRNGFSDVQVRFEIDADADADDIEALVAQSQKRSAVFDIMTNPTNVTVHVA